jgi:choline dehydrogenase-like flavoprotein
VLTRALASGNCTVLTGTTAERIVTDGAGRVTGVALVGGDGTWRRTVSAADVIVAAGAAESARLLLNSASDREPNGLGNNADQVGRHLQAHLYGGAIGVFEEDAQDLLGPGVSIGSADYRHGNPGVIGGGILANEFVTTPSNTYDYLASAGLIPAWGAGSKAGMVRLAKRLVRVQGPIHEVTMAESRVRIDPSVTDRYGIPVARLSGGLHPEDVRARDFLARRAAEWLEASGATNVRISSRSIPVGPSSGQHQAGTCRMGTDPATSVVDPLGRVWGHDNLRVADGSVHVTNGGVNPVLTIFANAFRIGEKMLAG